MKQCTVAGCDRPHKTNGLCNTHHHRVRRGYSLDHPIKPYRPGARCEFPGCDRPHKAKGWCYTHWRQQHEGRPLTPIREPVIEADDGWCWKCVDAEVLLRAGVAPQEAAERLSCKSWANLLRHLRRHLAEEPLWLAELVQRHSTGRGAT